LYSIRTRYRLSRNFILEGGDTNNGMGDNKGRSKGDEWYFHLKNDPEKYEKERFVNYINHISFIIKELQKLYDETPVTDHLFRANLLERIEYSNRTLLRRQAEYEMFKKYRKEQQ
jgi:hypothetical protein